MGKLQFKRQPFHDKLNRVKAALIDRRLVANDGSGDVNIEWLLTVLQLLASDKLEIIDDDNLFMVDFTEMENKAMYLEAQGMACYFCKRKGGFKREMFVLNGQIEVACLVCKHLIAERIRPDET